MRHWIPWLGALVVVTTGLIVAREQLDKDHVALVYLLVVLGASADSGRKVGLAVAVLAFLCFTFFFVPPYATFVVAHPVDWIILGAFLITSSVATHLLSISQSEARAARHRAMEMDRFAILGAEALNVPQPEEALPAVAEVIRATLGVARTEIYRREPTGGVVLLGEAGVAERVREDPPLLEGRPLAEWVAHSGQTIVERTDATARATDSIDKDDGGFSSDIRDARALLLPLKVRDRTVGVLRIAHREGLSVDAGQERFLRALAYYAALGVERVRLAGEARHVDALREADRMKDALLASVSHDLRTPLTTIKALAHDIRVEGDERAAVIEEEADRLNRFVADLLDLSRLTAGGLEMRLEINAIDDLLGAALRRIGGRLDGRKVNTAISPEEAILVGRFDFAHALHAVVNLLENALKYSPAETDIDLSARRVGEMVEVTVADRGSGIRPEEQARIFQPFYRPSASLADGVGLGLSIAQRLAVAQGGHIEYHARSGGGSVFTLYLPAADVVPQ
jgi:two-component system sensor histidine kinase KdpD